MAIDLEFTKNPQWIEKREAIWEKLKSSYSSEVTRKQRDALRQYFMTGIPPKKHEEIHQFAYVDLFPLQTEEGLSFCFREFFDSGLGGVKEDWQNYIWMIYADKRFDLDRKQSIFLFNLFCGNRFSPQKIFPFLAKGESDFREVSFDAYSMLSRFIGAIKNWLQNSKEDDCCPIQVDLIEYMFSIFPHVAEHKLYFVMPLSPSNNLLHGQKKEINDTISWCKKIHDFLKIFASGQIVANIDAEQQEKLNYIDRVRWQLDEMKAPEYPQTLIDHWQWVKEGKKLRNTPPPKV
jgi:hypothetical protein